MYSRLIKTKQQSSISSSFNGNRWQDKLRNRRLPIRTDKGCNDRGKGSTRQQSAQPLQPEWTAAQRPPPAIGQFPGSCCWPAAKIANKKSNWTLKFRERQTIYRANISPPSVDIRAGGATWWLIFLNSQNRLFPFLIIFNQQISSDWTNIPSWIRTDRHLAE